MPCTENYRICDLQIAGIASLNKFRNPRRAWKYPLDLKELDMFDTNKKMLAKVSQVRLRPLGLAFALTLLLAQPAFAAVTPDLTIPVNVYGGNLGQINLYIGTSNFAADGDQGIGKPSATGPQSGFTPAGGLQLNSAAEATGETGFNWLQIVIAQPAGQNGQFGAVPHADPSSDPNNATPHDNQPWYLNVGAAGGPPANPVNPPFDAPPGTSQFLPFQDFPSGLGGGAISFDTYLISTFANNTYDVLAGFTWTVTDPGNNDPYKVSGLQTISTALPANFQTIVKNYGPTPWTLAAVPAPPAAILFLLGGFSLLAMRFKSGSVA